MGRVPQLAILAIALVMSCNTSERSNAGAGAGADAGAGAETGARSTPGAGSTPGSDSAAAASAAGESAATAGAAVPEPPAPSRARIDTPASEFHLDDSERASYSSSSSRPRPRRIQAREQRPTIHITLKSTPSGAMVAVDGVGVGRTPAFWEGEVTGKPHEFTFVLPGHAMARYRFVPTSDGIVHGTLKRLSAEASEATPEP